MRKILVYLLYALSAFLDDVAFYVLGNEQEDIGLTIETLWCKHNY